MSVAFSLLYFVAVVASQTLTECPLEWILFNNNCYLFKVYPLLSYEVADKTCLARGAGLVSVNTDDENNFVTSNINQYNIQGRSIWYTSGSYFDMELMWEGDGTAGNDDDRYWISLDNKRSSYQGMRIAYKYFSSGSTSTYKWSRVTEDTLASYICEIPLVEVSRIIESRRDFTYGSSASDNENAPKGPAMKIQPKNLVVTSHSIEPNLECAAIGVPQPHYTWYRLENTAKTIITASKNYVITNGKLTFLNVSSEVAYSGNYHCKAENRFGSILSNVARITHGFLNEFSNVVPGRFNVSLYKGTYLNCNHPTYRPAANYQWQKGDEFLQTSLNQYYFLSSDGNLYFSEVQAQDSGYYHCLVTLTSLPDEKMWTSQPPSVTSKGIYLEVTGQTAADFPPEIQDSFPRVYPATPMRGFELRLECLAYGRMPLQYSWSRDRKPIPGKTRYEDLNRILVIENAQFEDEGTYICSVSSTKGFDEKRFTFALSAKPYFIHALQDMHVDINSQITWRCEVIARPRATYTWYKDSQVITSVPGKFEINSNVLKLTNIQLGDSGMYQCGASNVYGTVFGGAQLRVLSFKPSFDKSPLQSKMLAALNGNITIPCNPQAAPAPQITWLKDGIELNVPVYSTMDVNIGPHRLLNGHLIITKVTLGDAGVYTCRAINDLGEADSSTDLTVANEITLPVKPADETFVTWNGTQFIRCEASYDYDKYDLIYVWKFNGMMIDVENDPYFVKENGVNMHGLRIRFAQFKHDGYYECVATTTVSSVSAIGKLTVHGPPAEPAGVYAIKSTATPDSIKLTWTKPAERGSAITNYTIEAMTTFNPIWRKVGEVSDFDARSAPTDDSTDSKKRTYTVTGLLPYNNYTFRIFASNAFSVPGYPSIPSKSYTIPGAKPEYPVQYVGGGNGSFGTLQISWQPLSLEFEGGPEIKYHVYWRSKENNNSPFQYAELIGRQKKFVKTLTTNDYYKQYEIIVGVRNKYGIGPNSTMAVIYSAEMIPPHPPKGVAGSGVNGTALLVYWNPMPNTREVIGGTIQGFEINVVDLNDPNRKSVTAYIYGIVSSGYVIGLEPNADFWVTVQVFNTAGESFPSERTRMSTNAEPPRHYPEYVTVRSYGSDSVHVKWRGVLTGINEEVLIGYKLRWYPANEDIKQAINNDVIITNRKTEGIITGIEKRVIYKLRVLGYSNGGDGKMSPVTYFTLGGQGVPVTDPAMTDIVAGCQGRSYTLTSFLMGLVISYILV